MVALKAIFKKVSGKLYKLFSSRHSKHPKKLQQENLLYKYVLHDGNVIGESIAVFAEYLIIKDKGKMLCVSFDAIERVDDEHVYVADFNYDEALAAGVVWLEDSRDTLHFDKKGMMVYE